jgi:predicted O-methyltransferase YrrM
MNLSDTLNTIAAQLDLDAAQLDQFANEDQHGGYHPNFDDGCPIGSLFRVEGQTLYALVRALQPKTVVELGSFAGCSTTHLAAALEANGAGKLTAVDNALRGVKADVPAALQDRVNIVSAEAVDWLASRKANSVDFLFEDLEHTPGLTEAVWREALRVVRPGGLILSHDAAHWVVGEGVMAGIRAAGVEPLVVLAEPSDCGLAIYRKPVELDPGELVRTMPLSGEEMDALERGSTVTVEHDGDVVETDRRGKQKPVRKSGRK